MAMIQKTLNVDDEVVGICDALVSVATDIKAKKAAGQVIGDAVGALTQGLTNLGNIAADVKAHPDNAKYIGVAFVAVAQAFLLA